MVEIRNVSKKYKKGPDEFIALDSINIKVEKGDYVSVTGGSGAGKSTLLNIIGGLIHPDSGEVLYKGENIYRQNNRLSVEYRRNHIGFMFQQFHLMPYLTVLENIELAYTAEHKLDTILDLLKKCNLSSMINKYPSELSVGEKQRTAFIRAIISNPDILLADEPTGNLDPENSNILMSLVEEYHINGGTIVLVSHDPLVAKYSNKHITLIKGRITT